MCWSALSIYLVGKLQALFYAVYQASSLSCNNGFLDFMSSNKNSQYYIVIHLCALNYNGIDQCSQYLVFLKLLTSWHLNITITIRSISLIYIYYVFLLLIGNIIIISCCLFLQYSSNTLPCIFNSQSTIHSSNKSIKQDYE